MPYTQPMKPGESLCSIQNKEARAKVQKALDEGRSCEWVFSSFSDPGDDWQACKIDGETVPGSRQSGY